MHNSDKHYYELLAKYILETAFPNEYSNLDLNDKPDLLTKEGKGIEVTRSIYAGAEEASNYFEKHLKFRRPDEVDPAGLSRMQALGYNVLVPNDRIVGWGLSEGVWESVDYLKPAIRNKLGKAASYGTSCSLFVYAPSFNMYENSELKDLVEWMRTESTSGRCFDYLIVFDFDTVRRCSVMTSIIEEVKLTDAAMRQMEGMARYLST